MISLLVQLVICSILLSPVTAQSSRLQPLPEVELSKLEADVREQLTALQKSLTALTNDPATPAAKLSEAYGLLGQVYHAYSLTSAAEVCYLNARSLAPQDFRWCYLLGQLQQQEAQAEKAIEYYRLTRRLRPDYLPAPVHLGNVYLQLNRLAEARQSFNEALALNAQCTAARYGLGQLALAQRNYAEAAKYLAQALAEAPEANRIHYALALAYRGLGELTKAQEHLQRQGTVGVRVSDPLVEGLQGLVRGERLHLLRGQTAFAARRFAEAADEFRKAVVAHPGSLAARVNLGSALAQLGEGQGAIAQYQEALRLAPEHAEAHYNLGFLYAKARRHEQALAHLQAALKLNPKDAEARFLLAQELSALGRGDEALAEFSNLVAADPGHEEALLEQVKLLWRKQEYKIALASLEKSHALFPQKGRTAALLAYTLAASPQFALRDGARALTLARLVYQATNLLNHGVIVALALAETGQCQEAAEWQRKLLAAAEREGQTELAGKLKADLQRYEKGSSCRPPGEAALPQE